MAITPATGPKIAIGSFDFTTNANAMDVGVECDEQDVTTYASGGFRQVSVGLRTLAFGTQGFTDYGGSSLNEWLRSNYGAVGVVTVAYLGETAGNAAFISRGTVNGYRPTMLGSVGSVPTFDTKVSGNGSVVAEGQVTQVSTSTVTATGNSTAVNVGAVSASQSIYAAIHVFSVTGTTPSLTCQLASSTSSGGSYTTRGSAGSALSAAGSQWLSAAGAFTDTWWRLNYTVSGTSPVFTVRAVIAII